MNCSPRKSYSRSLVRCSNWRVLHVRAQFLDDIKELGFQMAFKGGLSIGLE